MKYRPRIYYTETDKALMWDRWQKGDGVCSSGSLFAERRISTVQLSQ